MSSHGIDYRTPGPWGAGLGRNLTPAEVDGNFYDHDGRLVDLETNPPVAVSIASIAVNGASMTIFLDDSTELGPFTLPTAEFNWRGDWAAGTSYFENDVFYVAGDGAFIVITDYESASAFDPGGAEIQRLTADGATGATGAAGADGADGTTINTLGDVPDVEYPTAGPAVGDGLVYRGGDVWLTEPLVGRQTVWVPAAAMQPTVSAGAGSDESAPGLATVELTAGRPNITYLPYASDIEQNAQFSIEMPKSWNRGTLVFQVTHSHAGGQTGGLDGVVWGLAAVAVGDGENIDVAFGTEVEVTKDASAADTEHKTAESAALTVAGTIAAGDTVYFNLARKIAAGADDLDIDARLHGLRLYYVTTAATDD